MNRERILPFVGRHRTVFTVLLNLLIATAAYVLAFTLRFDLSIPAGYVAVALWTLPTLLACKLVGFWSFRLFSGWWRHVTVYDVVDIARGNLLASTLFVVATVFVYGTEGFPRSVFVLDLLICTAMMCGIRVAIRLMRERDDERVSPRRIETLALIVGAGSAGIHLLEEIRSRRRLEIGVVGFVDDDPGKRGLRIAGIPVVGAIHELRELIAKYQVGEVLIAIPSAPGDVVRRIVQQCSGSGARHRVLPTLGELVRGRVMYTQMREVKVDDLLTREPVRLDLPRVREFVSGNTVLVTGAAGSIGSELCRQVAAYRPRELVLYDRHENGMYALEMELRIRFAGIPIVPVLGDILLPDQLATVFAEHEPQIVFHAAAYKHVPLAEQNVVEAVRNNVIGTYNVAATAAAHGVRDFVLVSTDKAVRPSSVMGVTKRVAEMVIRGLGKGSCRFVAVRFGNVLGSNGSVVPLFREQIARGGPVTVTHPDVTRYFMTIPEAVQLILQAATMGESGDILMLEMGDPVRIVDLARQMIRLSGFEPDEDIQIVFTGLRPGEKLHEQLIADEDAVAATSHDRIKLLRPRNRHVRVEECLAALESLVRTADRTGIIRALQDLVADYRPYDEAAAAPRSTDDERRDALLPDAQRLAALAPLAPDVGDAA